MTSLLAGWSLGPMGALPGTTALRLVGRLREKTALVALIDGARAGRPGAVIVHGEAGVGKTRLVREISDEFRHRGYEVLWGSCVHVGAATLPFASTAHCRAGSCR